MSRLQFKHLVVVSLLLAITALVLAPQLRNIVYRSDIIEYFQPEDPRVNAFRALETAFGFQQSLLILLQSDNKSFLESDKLNQLAQLEVELKALPGVTRIQSLLGNPVSDAEQQTRSARALLRENGTLDSSAAGQLADSRSSNGFALSHDQRVTALQLFFADEDAINRHYSAINTILDHHLAQQHFDRVHLLGPVEIKHALHHALMHDGVYLMPLVLVAGLGVLWFFLRSWWLVFSGALSIIIALMITAEIVGWLGLTINQTSGLAFGITFIIALADIIHLLMSYCHQPRTLSNTAAMLNSLRSNGVSLFLTSLTTAIGFLSLNGSSSPVFATFGNIAAIGVACAFITAITVTPVVAVRVAPTHQQHEPDIFLRLVRVIGRFNANLNTRKALLLYGIATLLCGGVLLNTFHNDPLDYFEASSPIRQATATSEQHFDIHHPISIVVDSRTTDGIFTPAFVGHITAFQNWLNADQRIAQQSSYLDTLRMLQQHVHEYNAKWASTPADGKTVADLWTLYEMASPDNTPQALGLDAHFRSAMVNVGVPRLQSSELIQLEQDIRQWFALNAPELRVRVTGHALLFAGIGKELTWNMFMGGLFSAMVISLLIGLFLGNLKVGIISLIPNLFPAGVIFGIWGAGVGVIDIAAAGTLSISLGIVVDDTIHVLKRYVGYRNAGHSPQWSLHQTFEEVGSALVLTTVVLTLGMLILTLSIFGPNRTTAQLMSSIIFIALLFDLIMLPHLLRALDRWLFRHVPVTQEDVALTNA
jgi:hypothetical protein